MSHIQDFSNQMLCRSWMITKDAALLNTVMLYWLCLWQTEFTIYVKLLFQCQRWGLGLQLHTQTYKIRLETRLGLEIWDSRTIFIECLCDWGSALWVYSSSPPHFYKWFEMSEDVKACSILAITIFMKGDLAQFSNYHRYSPLHFGMKNIHWELNNWQTLGSGLDDAVTHHLSKEQNSTDGLTLWPTDCKCYS